MAGHLKKIHLGASLPGSNNLNVWSDPQAGSQIAFSSFEHVARTAERAKFDFFFFGESLSLRQQHGQFYELDVAGRADALTMLAALAAVTERIGLTATINSTFNEPYEVARQFASLDHLSNGRAAWNVVTSWDAVIGENFRRGAYLPQSERYTRAKQFMYTVWELFSSWDGGEAGSFAIQTDHFDIAGQFAVPSSPQGRPVIFQAGDSDEGREFAAAAADVVFTEHGTLEGGKAFYSDVKRRLSNYGRNEDDLKIIPGAAVVLGDTDEEARHRAHEIRLQQVSGQTAIMFLEQLWNCDLSNYDPDGPLPPFDPDLGDPTIAPVRANQMRKFKDPVQTAKEWRELATLKKLSIREVIVEKTARPSFIGTPQTVAEAMNALVQADACDGFLLVPHIIPNGLDGFAERVVPLLQEWGVFRSEYEGATLREHLGVPNLPPVDSSVIRRVAHR